MGTAGRNSRASRVVATACLVSTSVWATAARADCKNDADCKGDRVCEKGTCVAPATPPPPAGPQPEAPPPAPPAAAPKEALPGVEVGIRGREGDPVSLEGLGARETCRSPCRLRVPPGRYTVRSKGFAEEIEVPNRPSTVSIGSGCTACYVGGGIALGVGIALAIAGQAARANEERRCGDRYGGNAFPGANIRNPECFAGATLMPDATYISDPDAVTSGTIVLVTGIVLAIGGAALITTGIVVGPAKATVGAGEGAAAARQAPPKIGLVGRGLGFTF